MQPQIHNIGVYNFKINDNGGLAGCGLHGYCRVSIVFQVNPIISLLYAALHDSACVYYNRK